MDAADKKVFDFSSFKSTQDAMAAGKEFEILDDLGRKTGVFFFIYGMTSPEYREGQRALNKRVLAAQRLGESDYEEEIADDAFHYSHCVGSWRTGDEPVIYLDGKPLPFSRENAEKVLTMSTMLRGQVRTRVQQASGFIEA